MSVNQIYNMDLIISSVLVVLAELSYRDRIKL